MIPYHLRRTSLVLAAVFSLGFFFQQRIVLADESPGAKQDPFAETLSKADKDGDGQLSLEEFQGLLGVSAVTKRDFRLFDRNRDGRLVRDEFATIPGIIPGVEPESHYHPVLILCDEIISKIDKAVGVWKEQPTVEIDANRMAEVIQSQLVSAGLQRNPISLDEDRNGKVSRAEARRFIEMELGIRRGDGKFLRLPDGRLFNYILFLHADENKNDRIERNEFVSRTFVTADVASKEFDAANKNGDDHLSFDEFKLVPGRGVFDPIYEFRVWDTNLDAFLSKEELLVGTPEWQRKIAENALPAFDLDKDGQLSLSEYQLTPQANMVLPWDWGMDDKDGDGFLSLAEFQFAPATFPAYDQTQFPLLRFTCFHLLDLNSDGKLDPKEYIYRRKTPDEFFVLNEDGTGWESLFRFEGHFACGSVAVSPDGKWMAFDSWPDINQAGSAIFVKELQGGEPRMIVSGMMPTWSKDGRFLTCSRHEPTYGVWILEVTGDQREHLCQGWGAQWSPDGESIAFSEGTTIKAFDIIRDEFRNIVNGEENGYQQIYWNMAWSPDGERLCFKGVKPDGTQEVATVSTVDDKPVIKVHHSVKGTALNADFAWHPRGERVVFAMFCKERGHTQLYEFNPGKDDPPVLLKGQDETRNNSDSCWTPDGKKLIVVSGDY
ncbi:hypothetical protein [Schlesneria sp. DSM 10557]|uniref:hypothetical protein n=1 Tax=Schlesneria sp. DSM 10557 TaxID=3044399 RepID=UPI0035A1AA7B